MAQIALHEKRRAILVTTSVFGQQIRTRETKKKTWFTLYRAHKWKEHPSVSTSASARQINNIQEHLAEVKHMRSSFEIQRIAHGKIFAWQSKEGKEKLNKKIK